MKEKKLNSSDLINILSPELLSDLSSGYNNNKNENCEQVNNSGKRKVDSDNIELVITSSKKKRHGSKDFKYSAPEKTISKSEQKRIVQIEKRKRKEASRDEYLKVIADNEISIDQRDILTSSKSVYTLGSNQTITSKQLLSNLLKRHRAGLSLLPEEYELLFPSKERREGEMPIELLQLSQLPQFEEEAVNPIGEAENENETNGVLFDFFSKKTTITTTKENINENDNKTGINTSTTKKKRSKKGILSSTSNSIGSKLLSQLSLLKKKHSEDVVKKEEDDNNNNNNDNKASISPDEKDSLVSKDLPIYVPVEVSLSMTAKGELLPSGNSSGDNNNNNNNNNTQRKRFVRVDRPEEVSLSRLQLPVCAMEQEIVEAVVGCCCCCFCRYLMSSWLLLLFLLLI
jgi:hypothetical protein